MQKLTIKQNLFCLKYLEFGNATEAAIAAGYSPRTATPTASRLLTYVNISERLTELQQKVEDASVATVLERKQILTEISRGRIADFTGEPITSDKLKSAAIQEIRVTDGDTSTATVKLNNPMQAIDLLNKMEKIYDNGGVTVNNTVNIQENIINAGERLDDAINRLVARIGEGEVPGGTE